MTTFPQTCRGPGIMEFAVPCERNSYDSVPSGRTSSSSLMFLFLFAPEIPFSQSGSVVDNGSCSSLDVDLFRLPAHFPYKYSAPNKTEMAYQQEETAGAWRLDGPKREATTIPMMIPFFFEHLTFCCLKTRHQPLLAMCRMRTKDGSHLLL